MCNVLSFPALTDREPRLLSFDLNLDDRFHMDLHCTIVYLDMIVINNLFINTDVFFIQQL